jgi:flavin reductase (DIM6/NTAB) family NADH-FMN oxidoreductase RutF
MDQILTADPAGHLSGVSDSFRDALQKVASAVSIVTTAHGGQDFGLTVSATAICAARSTPPTLIVSVNASSALVAPLRASEIMAVNFANEDQHELARQFIEVTPGGPEVFAPDIWKRQVTGALVLEGAVASMDCRIVDIIPHGTHLIFLGRVVAVASTDMGGLLYRGGLLRRLDSSL